MKCNDIEWCIVGRNAVGTLEVFVYFLQRNSWERKVALTKRGNPLPTSEAWGEDGGGEKSTVKHTIPPITAAGKT